jgi:hypothetical protein
MITGARSAPPPIGDTRRHPLPCPCPRLPAGAFLCPAPPCVNQAAARRPYPLTRDPLAVARDPACLPRGARSAGRGLPPAIRRPWRACPLACDLRSAGRDPLAVAPLPLPLACDPASSDGRSDGRSAGRSDGRSGVIRWPIRRHPMADPASSDACDPLAAQARSAARPGAIRCPPRRDPLPAQARSDGRDPPPAIRDPPVRVPYGN